MTDLEFKTVIIIPKPKPPLSTDLVLSDSRKPVDNSDVLNMESMPTMNTQKGSNSNSQIFRNHWHALKSVLDSKHEIEIDGRNLSLAHVVAVARFHCPIKIASSGYSKLEMSRNVLNETLASGVTIYGVNTGFGGSADLRNQQTQELQRVLIRELHYGILPGSTHESSASLNPSPNFRFNLQHAEEQALSHIPRSWARAGILLRMNSLSLGYSGVRPVILERMGSLLNHDIIPMIPLRGSLSASGDLSPLSYIGGAIQGKSTIRILDTTGRLSAQEAFVKANLEPVTLQAKEGLAIVNGTAISAACAALILHDALGLVVAGQVITALSVEALSGSLESFDPFFSESRPHAGQKDAAANILAFLRGSHFVKEYSGIENHLRQDRYSIRTAPQWIGPVLEDINLAHEQISVELNSTTDNPLISPDGRFLHGGNFQAKSVTNAMEKVRQGLHDIGRMIFGQCTELINPTTNNGLPPNLVIEDPNSSFIFKGTDVNIASLQSELGYLSNPCNHVMTAEMGNQSINSLALISARYTHTAGDVLSQMVAINTLALCQALDIRALYSEFFHVVRQDFVSIVDRSWTSKGGSKAVTGLIWSQIQIMFFQTVSEGNLDRFRSISLSIRSVCLDSEGCHQIDRPTVVIENLCQELAFMLQMHWNTVRSAYLIHGDATKYLGLAGKRVYNFVRKDLEIPILHSGVLRTPNPETLEGFGETSSSSVTVGTFNTKVYEAVRDGRFTNVLFDILRDVEDLK